MEQLTVPMYTHRRNADGTVDTICHKCYATVTNRPSEAGLDASEHEQVCDLQVLQHFHKSGDLYALRHRDLTLK